ncbi:glycine cleavage T C-terminal barrel domain-containing protein [Falsihalocynthiibacter arcticus]|uniref:glycine cleavage T C-terminal barrel domain-containing protein n=1 Tax=Falsihalocynthiibacter arcticus TaxID=1579316 RepID=UPI001F16F311|nr:glycine cleavage T C-terminal barrel domain-containing protein [Falsihalocynthiibacter arcticus]
MRSAAYGHTFGASVALCLIEAEEKITADFLRNHRFEIDLAGVKYATKAYLRTPYDPKNERPKSED